MFSHQARCETFLLLRLQNLRRQPRVEHKSSQALRHVFASKISFVAVRRARVGSVLRFMRCVSGSHRWF